MPKGKLQLAEPLTTKSTNKRRQHSWSQYTDDTTPH